MKEQAFVSGMSTSVSVCVLILPKPLDVAQAYRGKAGAGIGGSKEQPGRSGSVDCGLKDGEESRSRRNWHHLHTVLNGPSS